MSLDEEEGRRKEERKKNRNETFDFATRHDV